MRQLARLLCLGALALIGSAASASGQSTTAGAGDRAPWEWAAAVSASYRVVPNVVYHTAANYDAKLDLYLPTNARQAVPTVLYFHRGGWMHFSKETDNALLLPYLALGFAVVNADFRSGSVSAAPAAVEDARCALRWLLRNARQYNLDTSRIVVTGASAGGHLALMAAMAPVSAGFDRPCADEDASTLSGIQAWHGFPEVHVAAVVNWYGMPDVADLIDGANVKSYAVAWIGSRPDRSELARRLSPLSYIHADLMPILTVHGDADSVSPYTDAVRFHDALVGAGATSQLVTIHGGGHGGFTRDQTTDAYRRIVEFLTQAGVTGSSTPQRPQSSRMHRMGVLTTGANNDVTLAPGSRRAAALRKALADLGYREGTNLTIVTRVESARAADSRPAIERVEQAARGLLADSVELIVAGGSTEALAAKHVSQTVPIVFWSAEPVAEGLIESIAHPGGNATGVIRSVDTFAEPLSMLDGIAPGNGPIGFIYNPSYLPGVGVLQYTRRAADSLGLRLLVVEARDSASIGPAFDSLAAAGARAALVGNHGLFLLQSKRIVALAEANRLPLFSPYPEARDAGVLLAGPPDFIFWSRRAGVYIDKLLRGASPAELPVEQSVPKLYTVNLRAARTLGVTIPDWVIRRADHVVR